MWNLCVFFLFSLPCLADILRLPNLLIFFVDDLGYGDLGCQGNSTVHSPSIDTLASEGVRFTQWISADSICTPSRGALLTGRLPVRLGLAHSSNRNRGFSPFSSGGLPLEEHTLAEALKERGYNTHISGKWHLGVGNGRKYLPQNQGFDHHYGMAISNTYSCGGKWYLSLVGLYVFMLMKLQTKLMAMFFSLLLALAVRLISKRTFMKGIACMFCFSIFSTCMAYRFSQMSPTNCILFKDNDIWQQPVELANLTQRITNDASQFIEESVNQQEPFFLYMSYHKVHTALFSNDEFKVEEDEHHPNAEYLSNIRELDWSVGAIVSKLRELDIYEDTIIWLVSDNGPFIKLGSTEFMVSGEIKKLRGFKGTMFEGGIRVPGMVVYKKKFPSGIVSDKAVGTIDIFPTSLKLVDDVLGKQEEMTYTNNSPHTIIDGKDLSDFIQSLGGNEELSSPHSEMIHYCGDVLAAVRIDSRFKVYFMTTDDKFLNYLSTNLDCAGDHVVKHDPPLVYDLVNDIEEKSPLAEHNFSDYLNIVQRAQFAAEAHLITRERYPDRPGQMDEYMDYTLLPDLCCNPPFCSCDQEDIAVTS